MGIRLGGGGARAVMEVSYGRGDGGRVGGGGGGGGSWGGGGGIGMPVLGR